MYFMPPTSTYKIKLDMDCIFHIEIILFLFYRLQNQKFSTMYHY